mmetsp:Transcript_10913/g.67419  ORF Transcript_10913/g.67419 Transcript_10913/m.67419 type:complete len:98 (-) Transcript_10913:567-860(-)
MESSSLGKVVLSPTCAFTPSESRSKPLHNSIEYLSYHTHGLNSSRTNVCSVVFTPVMFFGVNASEWNAKHSANLSWNSWELAESTDVLVDEICCSLH